ncbi:MAG: hypothetical protein J6S14_05675 [Clostridia bacterium]|nr:hypothetical protein [Clostridia bacterium]
MIIRAVNELGDTIEMGTARVSAAAKQAGKPIVFEGVSKYGTKMFFSVRTGSKRMLGDDGTPYFKSTFSSLVYYYRNPDATVALIKSLRAEDRIFYVGKVLTITLESDGRRSEETVLDFICKTEDLVSLSENEDAGKTKKRKTRLPETEVGQEALSYIAKKEIDIHDGMLFD